MFGISRFGARALTLEVIHKLISDNQSAVMMVELMRDVVDDGVVRRETVLRRGIALCSIGSADKCRER